LDKRRTGTETIADVSEQIGSKVIIISGAQTRIGLGREKVQESEMASVLA
jgi:hypothetical protein